MTQLRAQACGADDMRCGCGNLLARWVEGGVELKCRRCKRTVVLPVEGASSVAERSLRPV